MLFVYGGQLALGKYAPASIADFVLLTQQAALSVSLRAALLQGVFALMDKLDQKQCAVCVSCGCGLTIIYFHVRQGTAAVGVCVR